MNNVTTRTISGIAFIIVMLACLMFNKYLFAALMVFIMSVMVILLLALAIVILVWCCKRGTIGSNKYGPDPLEETYVDVTPQAEVLKGSSSSSSLP